MRKNRDNTPNPYPPEQHFMNTEPGEQHCPRCQNINACAISAGQPASSCWCMQAPAQSTLLPATRACYCASCLTELSQNLKACADKP